jgi:hypothetical protein
MPHPHCNVGRDVGLKGIGSILFLKNGLKEICRKKYENHLRSNNYEYVQF